MLPVLFVLQQYSLQDKLPTSVVDDVTKALGDVRAAAAAEDVADLHAKIKVLSDASMKIGESLNQSSQGGGNSGGSSESAGGDSAGGGSAGGAQ